MKILHVFDHSLPIQDGYSYRSRAILLNQRAQGWQTVHLTSAKHVAQSLVETAEGLVFHRTAQPRGLLAGLPQLDQLAIVASLKKRLAEVVEAERPDLIHAHSPSLNGLAALSVARASRLPLVYEVRAFWEDAAVDQGRARVGDLRYRMTAASENWVLDRADAITTICAGLRGEMLKRGVAADKVTVIPNGVEVGDYHYDPAPDLGLARELGLQDSFVLGFVGSFYAYEGLDLLLEALPRIVAAMPRAKVLLVGGGLEDERLRRQAEVLGIADRVVFAGRVPHDQVARYYSLLDLAVFPRHSLRLTETVTPLKPLEAMALGRVCLASDVGGHRELIEDGVTGFLFNHGSAEALAKAAIRIAAERPALDLVRRAGRRFVERERSWRASVARYAAVYDRLTATAVAGRQPA